MDNINLLNYQNADKKYADAKGEAFFEKVVNEYRENNNINYVGDTGVFEDKDHPAIIREFIEKRNLITRYYVRDSLFDAIANS